MNAADTPPLTYDGLHEYIASKGNSPVLGTRIGRSPAGVAEHADDVGPFIKFTLDGQLIARISPGHVQFLSGAMPRGARRWVSQIAADNGLATTVSKVHGALCLDGDDHRPVHGRTYKVRGQG